MRSREPVTPPAEARGKLGAVGDRRRDCVAGGGGVTTVRTFNGVTVHLVDGPAKGTYDARLAEPPDTLRAVSSADGVSAVLDEPGDIPLMGEQLHVYHRESGPAFACVRSGRRRLPPPLDLLGHSDRTSGRWPR